MTTPMDSATFAAAVTNAHQAGHRERWIVVFEPEGSEPGAETYNVTSITYEEDLAGAIVIRGVRVEPAMMGMTP